MLLKASNFLHIFVPIPSPIASQLSPPLPIEKVRFLHITTGNRITEHLHRSNSRRPPITEAHHLQSTTVKGPTNTKPITLSIPELRMSLFDPLAFVNPMKLTRFALLDPTRGPRAHFSGSRVTFIHLDTAIFIYGTPLTLAPRSPKPSIFDKNHHFENLP